MTKPGASLKSRLRKSVLEEYRARGRGNNNLWLVTSVKTNTDWVLPSDRQLVHWIAFLESNREVADFDLTAGHVLSDDGEESKATALDAVAILKNRKVEWHEVKAGIPMRGVNRSDHNWN